MKCRLATFALAISSFCGLADGVRSGLGVKLEILSPLDCQVIQRTRDGGRIPIVVKVISPGLETQLQMKVNARITGPGLPQGWFEVPFMAQRNEFQLERLTPSGGWYRVETRVLVNGNELDAGASVNHVGVGEVFAVAGQSNSANYGEERQETQTGLVSAFDGVKWQLAKDPEPGAGGNKGSFMPVFGDEVAKHLKLPVGIVAMGIGSTSVREWLPAGTHFPRPPTLTRNVVKRGTNDWEAVGKVYTNFVGRLRQFGPHGLRAVLWHQGESDANQAPNRTLPGELYQKYLTELIRDSRQDVGWEIPWFVAQATYHNPRDKGSAGIRAAQKAVWESGLALPGPDTDGLTGEMRENNGEGVHFSGKGLKEHGRMWAECVVTWVTIVSPN